MNDTTEHDVLRPHADRPPSRPSLARSAATKPRTRVIVALAALAASISANAACGGDVPIGRGSGALEAEASVPDDPTGRCAQGLCAPAQPGDCPMAKCAQSGIGCVFGSMEHLRCVPDPAAGIGSAPPDQCTLIGDCTNDRFPTDGGTCPESACGEPPTCAFGTPKTSGCYDLGEEGDPLCVWNFTCE